MSGLTSFFPSKFLPSRDQPPESISHLRFSLETMPSSRKYKFDYEVCADVLLELCSVFRVLGPRTCTIFYRRRLGIVGRGRRSWWSLGGRAAGHGFKKGESFFPGASALGLWISGSNFAQRLHAGRQLRACFHATDHEGHNISFFIAQQPGECCDCGDDEAWCCPIACPPHPPAESATSRTISDDILHVPNYPYRVPVPPELRDTMGRTISLQHTRRPS
ncbi:hypothetical protein B0H17DRAFT_1215822 [Mycena rosella]|uniref:UBR-type domain-containing protein n=1 Tax=Mycena rosella TaxID=1033263 RepID=A0AAD7CDI6_MYCRO|nr:hypothetical protein B0H17DRAFT_1215822 [Mycena rosella]